ncbi:MAG: restriction endonuclease subunit S [Candidatus Ozemobacteraceae bacterium]
MKRFNLPKMWKMAKLGECCTIISGSTPKRDMPEYWKNEIPWVTPKDISNLDQPDIDDAPEYISRKGFESCSTTLLPKGTVLFSSRAPIGLVAITGREMCTNQGFKSLIPSLGINSRYLFFCMRYIAPTIAEMGNGATFKEVSKETMGRVLIPIPPINEQKEIAHVLESSWSIIRKRRETLRLADELLRSIFLDMFGDPITNPKSWPKKPLGNLLSFLTSDPRGWAEYYSENGAKFLRIQNVGKNRLLLDDIAFVTAPKGAEANRTRVQTGDVLLSITADLGRTAVIPEGFGEAHINQHLAILRTKGIRPLFLSAYLASNGGQSQVKQLNKAGVKAGLNFDDIRSISVIVPPDGKQHDFEKAHTQVIALIEKANAALKDTNNLFLSLQQRAFQGEL